MVWGIEWGRYIRSDMLLSEAFFAFLYVHSKAMALLKLLKMRDIALPFNIKHVSVTYDLEE